MHVVRLLTFSKHWRCFRTARVALSTSFTASTLQTSISCLCPLSESRRPVSRLSIPTEMFRVATSRSGVLTYRFAPSAPLLEAREFNWTEFSNPKPDIHFGDGEAFKREPIIPTLSSVEQSGLERG